MHRLEHAFPLIFQKLKEDPEQIARRAAIYAMGDSADMYMELNYDTLLATAEVADELYLSGTDSFFGKARALYSYVYYLEGKYEDSVYEALLSKTDLYTKILDPLVRSKTDEF
jgi:hypothetical protein